MSSRFGPTVVRYKCKGRRTGTRDRRFLPVPMDASRQPPCVLRSLFLLDAFPRVRLGDYWQIFVAPRFATRTRKAVRSSLRAIRRRGTYFRKSIFHRRSPIFLLRALYALSVPSFPLPFPLLPSLSPSHILLPFFSSLSPPFSPTSLPL